MVLRIRSLCIILLLSGFLLGSTWSKSTAQTVPGQGWSVPINLSESPSSSAAPTIVADKMGFVHTFWSEDLNGPPHPEGVAPEAGNAIMYRRSHNGLWTKTVDIFSAGRLVKLDDPEAVVDDQGVIHLVWRRDAVLYYSYANSWEADLVASWAEPFQLGPSLVGDIRPVLHENKVVVFYNQMYGEQMGLYALIIEDGEVSVPVLVWRDPRGFFPFYYTAAVDGRGRIHVTWEAFQGTNTSEMEIYYTYSEDGGNTWAESRLVADGIAEEDRIWDAAPWVFTKGEDEIHLQWAQGIHTYRWHQVSRDGGKTWTKAIQLWPDLVSQTRSFAVGTDSNGNLYWADVLRYPNGGYIMRWLGDEWQQPELFYLISEDENQPVTSKIHIHGIRMAIMFGNEMHLIFKDQDRGEIWYMWKPLDAARIEPEPIPTQEPTPSSEVGSPSEGGLSAPQPTRVVLPETSLASPPEVYSANPGFGIIAGAVPVFFLLSLVLLRNLWKNK